jgi:hypothetical protein
MSIIIYDIKDRRGGCYYKRKFTYEEAEMIREEYKTGVFTQGQLATKYQVSQPLINQILSKKTYKKD